MSDAGELLESEIAKMKERYPDICNGLWELGPLVKPLQIMAEKHPDLYLEAVKEYVAAEWTHLRLIRGE